MLPPFLSVRELGLTFGGKALFEKISFNLHKGERVCLVGRNGCGKSTLLKVLANKMDHDVGDIFIQPGTKVAYLPQQVELPSHLNPLDYITSSGGERYLAQSYLDQLGLSFDQPMVNLSGGEQRRVALALALSMQGDILLLDEPTNHLDLTAIEWLEDLLSKFNGSVITISHDRAFLNKVSNCTYWMDRGHLFINKKGYLDFERWSDSLLMEEEKHLDKLNVKLRQEQEWLHRGVTARRKRNQGRLRQLMSLRQQKKEVLQNTPGKLSFSQTEADAGSKLIFEAKNIRHAYGPKLLIKDFSTRIMRQDRLGVIGSNGTGKTTLLKILVGQIVPDEGTVKKGAKIDLVYFDQMRDTLNPNDTLWQTLCPTGGDQVYVGGQYRHVIGYLKDFLFDEKQARGPVSILSGGEKNRLALAKALAQPSNVLILDEPTNDLDIDTLDLLTEMLTDYEGTVIIVSHDRDFLNKTVTSIIALEGGGIIEEYVGGYDDYLHQRKAKQSTIVKSKKPAKEVKETNENSSSKRLTYNQQRLLKILPEKIEDLEKSIKTIEAQLSNPELYSNEPAQYLSLTKKLESLTTELKQSEETWLELSLIE